MKNNYIIDLLTNKVHRDGCDCASEVLPENTKSLGFHRYAMEAVLEAKNLGYSDALCTCEKCDIEFSE